MKTAGISPASCAPPRERRHRIADGGPGDLFEPRLAEQGGAGHAIDGRQTRRGDARPSTPRSARRREVDAAGVGERLERRDADDAAAVDEGEPLDRRDPMRRPVKDPGPEATAVEIDVSERETVRVGERENLGGQPFGVRARAVAAPLIDNAIIVASATLPARVVVSSASARITVALSCQLSAVSCRKPRAES